LALEAYQMNEDSSPAGASPHPTDESLVSYTHVIYGLHTLSVVIGVLGSATIVGSFVFGLPSIIAVIMNYARRSAVRGSFLEAHFSWQIRTFWYALAWIAVASLVSLVLLPLLGLGILTWFAAALIIGVWVIYRVARGWLALRDGKSVP
jgi:uncharacterized membrane protein